MSCGMVRNRFTDAMVECAVERAGAVVHSEGALRGRPAARCMCFHSPKPVALGASSHGRRRADVCGRIAARGQHRLARTADLVTHL